MHHVNRRANPRKQEIDAGGRAVRTNPVAEQFTFTGGSEIEGLGRSLSQVFHIMSEETRLRSRPPWIAYSMKKWRRAGTIDTCLRPHGQI